MAMSTGGGGGGLTNEPNVTPMIDVLLVLLIIFMMVIPMARKAIDIQLPDPNPAVAPANAVSQQIVLEVLPNGAFAVNKEPLNKDNLDEAAQGDLRSAPRQADLRQGRSEGEIPGRDLRDGHGARRPA